MKRLAIRIGILLLLSGAALAAVALLLWSDGGGQHEARAYPGLTVGIDLDPNTPAAYESCIAISGVGVSLDVDVFVLDVVDLMAFSADVEYDSSVIEITGVDTDLLLGSPPGSSVVDGSLPGPPGKYEAAAFDQNQVGADGSGILVRLTVEAIAAGVSEFNIAMEDLDGDTLLDRGVLLQDVNAVYLGDISAPPDGFFDGPFINEETTISVGGAGDTDGDGVPEGCDNCPGLFNDQMDTDGDGMGDKCDPDDDNDGIPDFIPPGPDNCRLVPNPFDADGDGQDGEDPIDGIDNDADTLVDEDHEMGQEDWNNGGGGDVCQDTDGDGVMDYPDNCRSNANANQADMDGDGVGDVCDPDKDGDGYDNGDDNCPDAYNPDQADTDGDGTGDACQDSDGDGWFDTEDNCPAVPNPSQDDNDSDDVGNPCDNCQYEWNPGQENNDGDALGDVCDWDDDNDSICDPGETSQYCTGSDNCQLIANGPSQGAIQCVGNQTDTDGDGLGDACDDDGDADGFSRNDENQWGSKDCQYTSVPEVCDGVDNDLDGSTDEGWGEPPTPFLDSDGDTTVDCMDENWDTDGDGTADKFDDDDDDDRFLDTEEHWMPTDSLRDCDDGIGYPDWAADFDDNKEINILDIVQLTPPVFGSEGDPNGDGYFTDADPWYSRRMDLNGDKTINILDIVRLTPPTFGSTCTP